MAHDTTWLSAGVIRPRDLARESLAQFPLLFLFFALATLLVFRQWIPMLDQALIGPPEDNMNDFWNSWYAALGRNPDHFFVTNLIRFPEGTPLYYQSFAYPKVALVALFAKLFGTDVNSLILLQNLSLLVSFPLAASGAFYLVRHCTGSSPGALLGGFVFAFNPSHIEHAMHHANVAAIEGIPFFVLAYCLAIERRDSRQLLLAIMLFAFTALCCWYYLFYLGYFVVFHTAYGAIRNRALPAGFALFAPFACLAGVLAVLSPILLPMVIAAVNGPSVYLDGSNRFVADLFAYTAFPRFHAFAPVSDGVFLRLTGNEWEATVYLGLVNIAVLVWLGLFARGKDQALTTYVLAGMAVFGLFASGDWLHVLGQSIIPLPDSILSQLPFFGNVRTPSRAIVFVYLFLAIGVGHAFDLALRQAQGNRGRIAMAALAGLIILDFLPARPLAATPFACSRGLAIIRDDPERDFGVLDLPSGKPAAYVPGQYFMLQQACHGRAIAQGNTSRDIAVSLRDRLETRDLALQRRQLAAARVKYIVINREAEALQFGWFPEDGQKDEYFATYPVIYDGPDLAILKVY
jgi:hypothetical protein